MDFNQFSNLALLRRARLLEHWKTQAQRQVAEDNTGMGAWVRLQELQVQTYAELHRRV